MAQIGGLAEQLLGLLRPVTAEYQQAAAGGHLQLLALPLKPEPGDQLPDFVGQLARPGFRAVLDIERKGITGQAGQGVALAYPKPENGGQFTQVTVADSAAGAFVVMPEVVQVQEQQVVGKLPAMRIGQRAFQVLDKGTAIDQAGDRVKPHSSVVIQIPPETVGNVPSHLHGADKLMICTPHALEVELVHRYVVTGLIERHFGNESFSLEGPVSHPLVEPALVGKVFEQCLQGGSRVGAATERFLELTGPRVVKLQQLQLRADRHNQIVGGTPDGIKQALQLLLFGPAAHGIAGIGDHAAQFSGTFAFVEGLTGEGYRL